MTDPNLISLGLLGLSVVQTVALAYIAARYQTARMDARDASEQSNADRVSDTANREAESRDVAAKSAK